SLSVRSVSIRSLRILYFSRSSSYTLSVKLMREIIDFSVLFLMLFKWQQSSPWSHFLSIYTDYLLDNVKTMTYHDCVTLTVRDTQLMMNIAKTLR
ncbi:hypothetical protein BDDG_11594, partial [Blastomyces dermatitidis ATCC 18188]